MPYLGDGTDGYKARDTSRQAAEETQSRSASLRSMAARCLRDAPDGLTADEVAERIGMGPLSIRPRITELAQAGEVIDSGRRRRNASGKTAVVWLAGRGAE